PLNHLTILFSLHFLFRRRRCSFLLLLFSILNHSFIRGLLTFFFAIINIFICFHHLIRILIFIRHFRFRSFYVLFCFIWNLLLISRRLISSHFDRISIWVRFFSVL